MNDDWALMFVGAAFAGVVRLVLVLAIPLESHSNIANKIGNGELVVVPELDKHGDPIPGEFVLAKPKDGA